MSENKYIFNKLTPDNNVNLEAYEDAIKFVFKNKDIKNVAIAGPYSSGKSSLIETYKEKKESFDPIHISLSHFESTNSEKFSGASYNDKNGHTYYSQSSNPNDAVLEGKILNQLIHQSDPKKIPQSNFKLKEKVSKLQILLISFLTALFVLLLVYMMFFNQWTNYVTSIDNRWYFQNALSWTTNNQMLIIAGFINIVLFGLAVYFGVKTQKNKNLLKKLSIQGNEIEIFHETNDSYFDKYLNEVLYLFENIDTNVIVFEDIDRFYANQIFGKLREINTLVNNKRTNNGKLNYTPVSGLNKKSP